MENYEIRLVRGQGQSVVYASTYISDYAALRGARMIARSEDGIEIWRGMHCIYRDRADRIAGRPPGQARAMGL
jgi:hypothetical protein